LRELTQCNPIILADLKVSWMTVKKNKDEIKKKKNKNE
jgi:hypothetical protein